MGKSNVKFDFDLGEIEKEILSDVRKNVDQIPIEIECPKCGKEYEAFEGLNTCPHCGAETNLDVKVDF